MDLWIRNQDKDVLTKCDDIRIETADGETKCVIRKYSNNNNWVRLGTYKSKESALQVLDEIHNILQPRIIYREPEINYDDMIQSLSENVVIKANQKIDMELKQAGQVVYQMPEE